jgi:hypothetical protein
MANPEPVPQPKPASPQPDAGHISMSEEMDRAKWTLPPIIPLLIAAAIVAIVLFAYSFHATKPLASGKILGVDAAEQVDQQHVIAAVQLQVSNVTDKPLWIKQVTVQVKPSGGDKALLEDQGAPAAEFDRYLQAFPGLAAHKMDAMATDTKIAPGATVQGMVIVAFPESKADFDKRQWLHVKIEPYDHQPFTIQ